MKTKSYNYNEAVKNKAEERLLTSDQTVKYIQSSEIPLDWESYSKRAVEVIKDIQDKDDVAYNSDVADILLKKLGLSSELSAPIKKKAKRIVYNSQSKYRAKKTIELYKKMLADGYIHCSDITEDMDGKKALLTGKITMDFLSSTKKDEPIKLVCRDDVKGYQKPRQRTRFYRFGIDEDLFIKVIK
jgi:hypothetical protein